MASDKSTINATYLDPITSPTNGTVTVDDYVAVTSESLASGYHPATVAGASVGVIIGIVIVVFVILFFVVYFRFPQKLLKCILNLHLRVAGLQRKSAISTTGEE